MKPALSYTSIFSLIPLAARASDAAGNNLCQEAVVDHGPASQFASHTACATGAWCSVADRMQRLPQDGRIW